jgi:luciferase-type oxidoreductase
VSQHHAESDGDALFETDQLTVGVGFPLTDARTSQPSISRELNLAAHAESVGFDAVWARDVPLYWPKFGDAGQTFDTWPWLATVAAHTDEIRLGTASVVLPLRHPIHVAKSAATVDQLSDGRLVMGIATGDRDPEYDAFGVDADERGERFRESVRWLRTLWSEQFPELDGQWGRLDGELDLVPKPASEIPLLPTGHARQELDWIGTHGDGWLFYHLPDDTLESFLADWREVGGQKPFAMALQADVADDPAADPEPVHQGYRAGIEWFETYFAQLDRLGVDHVILGVSGDDPESALTAFGETVLASL